MEKKNRLITLFSGYDSQALALKYLGIEFEHYKTCEWAIKSIQALKDLHFQNNTIDYSNNVSLEDIYKYLYKKGISSDYNKPMTLNSIARLKEKARVIYNNIIATHNLVNIQQVKGKDLEIVDKNKYNYIITYSYPCQDLSLAGCCKGMGKGSGTRSGLLWEVERILDECKELNSLPQILLMENVPQVHSKKNINDFNQWIEKLKELGYTNYYQDLNGKDYAIPQNRKRCFMVSLLSDIRGGYLFPKPVELKLKLKDLYESNVEEKYYISDNMKNYLISSNDKYKINTNSLVINRDIACAKTTREGWTRPDTSDYVCDELPGNYNLKLCKSVTNMLKETFNNKDIQIGSFIDCYHKTIKNGYAGTITTRIDGSNNFYITEEKYKELKIRKLTPRECFRLMGVKDEDFDKIKVNQKDSSLYHLAGDSIIVNVLEEIFKSIFAYIGETNND